MTLRVVCHSKNVCLHLIESSKIILMTDYEQYNDKET